MMHCFQMGLLKQMTDAGPGAPRATGAQQGMLHYPQQTGEGREQTGRLWQFGRLVGQMGNRVEGWQSSRRFRVFSNCSCASKTQDVSLDFSLNVSGHFLEASWTFSGLQVGLLHNLI